MVEEKEETILLRKYFSSWKAYKSGKKGASDVLSIYSKEHLVSDQGKYLQYQRNKRVNAVVKKFIDGIRDKVKRRKAVKTFQKHLSLKVLVFDSEDCFYSVSDIDKTHRIIIGIHQQSLLQNILFYADQYSGKSQPYMIRPCYDYISIRMVDSYRSEDQHNLYRMFLQPSMRCIF